MPHNPPAQLKRALGPVLLTFYGLGTILGAGIYVLVGEVAARAGIWTPWAFLLAGLLAALTAFSYAELSARYPFSAGEAHYVEAATGRRALAGLTALMVVAVGLTSAATIANGFAAYLQLFLPVPRPVAVSLLLITLGIIAGAGITGSALLAALITVIEISGLVLVVVVGHEGITRWASAMTSAATTIDTHAVSGILSGAFLAFFAFIGFEDMVNVAEEVEKPRRTLPTAIVMALAIATILYLLVAIVTVFSVPAQHSGSSTPLADVVRYHSPRLEPMIILVSMLAVVNGALIQIIMAARVIYGLAGKGMLPARLGRVHHRTQTPLLATAIAVIIVLLLALCFRLVALASITSLVTLLVFALVNLSLILVKRRQAAGQILDDTPYNDPLDNDLLDIPLWIPVAGLVFSLVFAIQALL